MTKPLHAGQCGRHGLLAALLAEAGFEANPEALEHQQGFLNAFNGPGRYQVEPLREETVCAVPRVTLQTVRSRVKALLGI